MSIAAMILGESGTGKSTSLRNLDSSQTLLVQSVRKPLPFRSKNWRERSQTQKDGNVFVSDISAQIVAAMQRSKHPVVVIDDFQYVLANEFMRRVTDDERGNAAFAKYNVIAKNAWDIITAASQLEPHRRVYLMAHSATDEFGKTKIKTIGKLLDEKIVLEGLVTIVLRTSIINGQYLFSTRNNGSDTVKTPLGLFDADHIDNDLAAVDAAIVDYYQLQATA